MATPASAGSAPSPGHNPRARRYGLVALGLVALAGFVAAQMALQTRFNVHPDESAHTHAFCYFETHPWLPPLNAPDVEYDLYGQSRVYSREVVYQVFGTLTRVLTRLTGQTTPCEAHYTTFRLLNVLTLLVTLGFVFAVGARHAWAVALGVLMLATPQVLYLYSYANSDGLALSASLGLMLLALTERRPLTSLRRTLVLGVLTALVVLSKSSYWMSLIFAFGVLAWRVWQNSRADGQGFWRARAANGLALAVLVLGLIAPLRIYYPLSQGGDFAAKLEQAREDHASPELKPSTGAYPTARLRAKGVPFVAVLTSWPWFQATAMSFYGLFGYMTEHAPRLAYAVALLALGLNSVLTVNVAARRWPAVPNLWKIGLMLGVVMGACGVLASLYYSWTVDFQPQGRYLFPILVPLALAFGGTWPLETRRTRVVRLVSAAMAVAAAGYALWLAVLHNPALT